MWQRHFFRNSLSLSFFLVFLVSGMNAQNPQDAGTVPATGPAAQSSTTPIVQNVDEVVIDFVARNKKKKPALDLKPEDVTITDNGSAVKLSDLRLVTTQANGINRGPASRNPNTSNHLITFLFDPLDTSAATNARDIARKILKYIPANGFSFSVFNVNGRLRLLQDFTADRPEIQKAINDAASDDTAILAKSSGDAEKKLISVVQSGGSQSPMQAPANDRVIEQATLASLTASQRIMQDQHLGAPLAGLLAIVRSLGTIHGRKLLVYFSEGKQSDPDTRDVLRSIADAANRAEVSVYVINQTAVDSQLMDGLMEAAAIGQIAASNKTAPMFPAAGQSQVAVAFGPGMASALTDTLTRMEGEGLAGTKDPLGELAANTGGAYIYSEDNLKKPFARAVADLTTYYEASYVPPALDYNGKFRPVTVKSVRHDLTVQARPGYFAVPPKTRTRMFEAPLVKLLSEAELPGDVKFRTAVLQLGNLSTGNESTLVTEVPVSALEIRSEPNANLVTWHVSIVSQIKNDSGAVVEHFSDDIPGHGALELEEQAKLGYATMQRHVALPPGKYVLETAVADRIGGKLGGQRLNFEVPVAAAGPFLSEVTLVRRIDSTPEDLDPFEPLRYLHGTVVPSLSGQVSPEAKNLSFFFLVSTDSAISEPALLEMQVLRNGELLGQTPLQLPKNLERSFPYVASLKTDSLAPGNYDVRLSLAQGERIIERERTFSIAGPQLARASLDTTGSEKNSEGSDGALTVTDSAPEGPDGLPGRRQPLVITSLPTDAITRPSEDELTGIIAGARKQATSYSTKLPNFLCVEVTDRSVDSTGNGRWRRKDSFGELLRYVDNQETRTTLEVNGQPSKMKRADMKDWPISVGEFGDLLNLVFQPASKTDFHWKETDALSHGTVQAFEYRVESHNNSLRLTDDRKQVNAGFHGVAYIDSATMGIRRITMEADNLPADFSIHAASMAIDYDYVRVGANSYLMPVRGTIRLKRGRHEVDLNQIVFQDYRRYASETKIIAVP